MAAILAILMTPALTYAKAVLSGEIVAGKWTRLAAQRHIDDLKRQKAAEFPFIFDEKRAEFAIAFIEQLTHTKGEWAVRKTVDEAKIKLELWEKFIVSELFGWRKADGTRRYRRAYIEVARKNGKTTFAAAIANLLFFADRPEEAGPEIYFGATKQEQAALAWREAKMQIERNPTLAKRIRSYASKQFIVKLGDPAARMRPLGRDSKTEDGLNPHAYVIDEYHAHPDSSLLDVLESGTGARRQPLGIIITTAGLDKSGPCFLQEHALAERILERSKGAVPEDCFAIIYALDDGDDFTNPAVWMKPNPNLGVSVDPEFLASRVQLALASPAKANEILTKNFNVWTQAATRWITDEKWIACGGEVDEAALLGRRCFLAMDLSSSIDITALCAVFPPIEAGEKWKMFWRFFIPEENLIERERRDEVDYTLWVKQGLVIATPGNVIDYDWVEQEILVLAERYEIVEVPYDPWKAQEIVNHLMAEGLTMVPIRQNYNPMAGFSDAFERKVLAGEVAHGGNPVARWMMSCTEVKSDRQGNFMPMKPLRDRTGKRIDGIVAAIMALGRGVVNENADSTIYAERGVLSV